MQPSQDPLAPEVHEARPRPLGELLPAVEGVEMSAAPEGVRVRGITAHSQKVREGDIFVAIRGTRTDGHDFVEEAVRRGAAAVVVERSPAEAPEVAVVRVPDSRRAFAELAAAWYGFPARHLPLVGITGTLGKTSVLSMLEAILLAGGQRVGTVGSLGIRVAGEAVETGFTAPDPLILQKGLAHLVDEGCELAAMEVTSHGLSQKRVHGVRYGMGVFTNLVPLEHVDYHGSFRNYVEVKSLFFDHLVPGAPLVHSSDDRAVRGVLQGRDVLPVGCGRTQAADVRINLAEMDADGSRLSLVVRSPLPRMGGGEVPPLTLPLSLRLLGRSNVSNAALAAATALCLGAEPDSIQRALAALPPPKRRMQIIHRGAFTVLDDTVGHPDSITAVFEVVQALSPRRFHMVFGIRGQRGVRINRRTAEALAIWAGKVPPETLIVTRCEGTADERNRVDPEEREAFLDALRDAGIPFEERERTDDAVTSALERAEPGDLVLLLGAQGMDAAAPMARQWLEEREEAGSAA